MQKLLLFLKSILQGNVSIITADGRIIQVLKVFQQTFTFYKDTRVLIFDVKANFFH